MINENTLSKLQSLGFGADIDTLESYIVDFQMASRLTDIERYRYNYDKMVELLKEIKPDSKAINESEQQVEIPIDQYDKFFGQYGNIRKCSAYGILDNIATSDIKEKINKSIDSMSDILALVNVQGLDVMCVYKDGYLCKVFLISESKKIMDITYLIESNLPSRIKEISKYNIVEFRGKLTIDKNNINIKNLSKHIETSIMHSIRCKIYTQELTIVFNDIMLDEIKFSTQWDKMEFMQSMDINVVPYVLVRGIDCDIISQALVDIDKTFDSMQNTMEWYTYGTEIRLNTFMDNTTGFICVLDDADYRKTFEAIVKSVITDVLSNAQILKIVDTDCNKRFTINSIGLTDIYDIEKYEIAIGGKVRFRVIEGVPILI